MEFSRDELTAQGVTEGSQSVYLTGFSYAVALSACELATHRYNWSDMTDSEWDETEANVSELMEQLMIPGDIGTVVALMTAVIPDRYLLCNGSTHAREDYPYLYEVLPAALIIDADTFTVPDMAGLAVVGATIARPLLTTFGEAEHTLTEAELARHAHYYTEPVANVDLEDIGAPEVAASRAIFPTLTEYAGGDQPHNNLPPSISLYWCVVAR